MSSELQAQTHIAIMSEFPWSSKKLPKQIFINNEFVDSKSSKKLTLNNPATGDLIADDVPISGEQDVDAAVAAAEKAFPAWKKISPTERRNIMQKFADLVEKNSLAIAELTRISLGAPYQAFGAFEIGLCAEVSSNSPTLVFDTKYEQRTTFRAIPATFHKLTTL